MPEVNGVYQPLMPGPIPPNGGRWIQEDWEEPGWFGLEVFPYRDSISVVLQDTSLELIDTLDARCGKMCDEIEIEEKHEVEKQLSYTTGWEISGEASGTIPIGSGELGLALGGSYSESKTVTDVVKTEFPHGDKKDHFRLYSKKVLTMKETYEATITRYNKNRWGGIYEGHPIKDGWPQYNEWVPQERLMGKVKVVHYKSPILGKTKFRDIPCSNWIEPTPGGGPVIIPENRVSLPQNTTEWMKFNPEDIGKIIQKNKNSITEKSKIALKAIFSDDESTFKKLEEEFLELKPNDELMGNDPFIWMFLKRKFNIIL